MLLLLSALPVTPDLHCIALLYGSCWTYERREGLVERLLKNLMTHQGTLDARVMTSKAPLTQPFVELPTTHQGITHQKDPTGPSMT